MKKIFTFPVRRASMRRPGMVRAHLRLQRLESRTVPSVNLGSNFIGLNFTDSGTGAEPPDTIGAAGLNHYVEAVNDVMRIYSKSGGVVSTEQLSTFFGNGLGGVLLLTDPVVTYDEVSQKFVIGILDFDRTSHSRFDFAVSDTSDPTGSWTFRRYDMNDGVGGFDAADYPKIGYNADGYVVSFNMFINYAVFDHSDVLAIDRATLTGVRTIVPGLTPLGITHFTMATATMHGSVTGDPMWFVEEDLGGVLAVDKMTNVFSATPSFTSYSIPVSPYGPAPNPQQPGGTLDSLGERFYFSAVRNNHLVAAHTVGTAGIARVRWCDIDISGASPVLHQEGEINQGPSVDTFFPSIDIDPSGNLGMTFSESSPTAPSGYYSMYVTGRLATDALGTMRTPVLVKQGEDFYAGFRAGDYSFVSIDPVDGSFWAANEYARTPSTSYWGTWIGNFNVTATGTPSILSLSASPAPVIQGNNLTLTADGVFNSVASVSFYRDANGDGVLDSGDTLLGTDTNAFDGWSLTTAIPSNFPSGTYTYFAQATDSNSQLSNVVSTTNAVTAPLGIVSLSGSPDPVVRGQNLTLTANGVTGSVLGVSFYRDANGDGILEPGTDTLLGTDSNGSDGWSLTTAIPNNFATGTYTYFAQATDTNNLLSNVVSTTNTVIAPPTIASLSDSPDPVLRGQNLTLTASGVTGSVLSVSFYRDANGDGILEPGTDTLLGTDTNGSDGWSLTTTVPSNFPGGTYTYFAQATDSNNLLSNVVSTTNTVVAPPTIASLSDNPDPVLRGQNLTLTANSVMGRVVGVSFYRDANGDGILEPGTDTLLGTDTNGSDGWSLTFAIAKTARLGTYTYFAQAQDDFHQLSNVVSTTNTVVTAVKKSGHATTAATLGAGLAQNLAAFQVVMAEWDRTDVIFNTRRSDLLNLESDVGVGESSTAAILLNRQRQDSTPALAGNPAPSAPPRAAGSRSTQRLDLTEAATWHGMSRAGFAMDRLWALNPLEDLEHLDSFLTTHKSSR
jgi:hypothetical protein